MVFVQQYRKSLADCFEIRSKIPFPVCPGQNLRQLRTQNPPVLRLRNFTWSKSQEDFVNLFLRWYFFIKIKQLWDNQITVFIIDRRFSHKLDSIRISVLYGITKIFKKNYQKCQKHCFCIILMAKSY